MRCNKVKKSMFLFFDNKLKPKQKENIKEHLRKCPSCMETYKEGELMMRVLRGGEPKDLPEGLHQNIMKQVLASKAVNEITFKENKFAFDMAIKRVGLAFATIFAFLLVASSISLEDFETNFPELKGAADNLGITSFFNKDRASDLNDDQADYDNKEGIYGASGILESSSINEEALDMSPQVMSFDRSAGENKQADNTTDYNEPVSITNIKVLKNAEIGIEINEFDKNINSIKNLVYTNSGFIEREEIVSNVMGTKDLKEGTLYLKLPVSNFDYFNYELASFGRVVRESVETKDDSKYYLEINNKLKVVEENKKDLDELKNNITGKEDLNVLIDKVEEFNETSNHYNSMINSWDSLVPFSEVSLLIKEVTEPINTQPKEFKTVVKDSTKNAFTGFRVHVQNFLIWIARNWINVICVTLLLIIIYFPLKVFFNKKNKY